jgi:hypothetical protein
MIGTSSFNPFVAARAALTRGVFAAAVVAAGADVAGAGEPRGHALGDCEQFACALTAGGRQASDKDKHGDQKPDRDGRRGRSDGEGRGSGTSYDLGWGYGKGLGETRAPRPPEWEETQAFMRQYARRRQSAVDRMPEGEAKQSVKKFVFARFRSLQSMRRRDPAGYEQRLAQLRVEDQIFGIVSDWSEADDDAHRQQLRDALRTQVEQLVELDLQERHRRVESLRRDLAEEVELLDRDEKQREALVEKRVSRFAEWAGRWAARRKQNAAEKREGDTEHQDAKETGKDPAPKDAPDKKGG